MSRTTGGVELEEMWAHRAAVVNGAGDTSVVPEPEPEPERSPSPQASRSTKVWTRERAIEAIREVAEKLGKTPTIAAMAANGYPFAGSCSNLGLPRFTELVLEAGLTPGKRGGRPPSAPRPPDPHAAPLSASDRFDPDALSAEAAELRRRADALDNVATAIRELRDLEQT